MRLVLALIMIVTLPLTSVAQGGMLQAGSISIEVCHCSDCCDEKKPPSAKKRCACSPSTLPVVVPLSGTPDSAQLPAPEVSWEGWFQFDDSPRQAHHRPEIPPPRPSSSFLY